MKGGRILLRLTLGALALAATGAVVLFLVVYVALVEPWPFSLRQGPDTDYAREVVHRYFGTTPPEGIQRLYAWDSWAGPGESILYLKFRFDDEKVLHRFLTPDSFWRLERLSDKEMARLTTFRGPSWWPPDAELRRFPRAYRRGNAVVWVDPSGRLAYLQDARV